MAIVHYQKMLLLLAETLYEDCYNLCPSLLHKLNKFIQSFHRSHVSNVSAHGREIGNRGSVKVPSNPYNSIYFYSSSFSPQAVSCSSVGSQWDDNGNLLPTVNKCLSYHKNVVKNTLEIISVPADSYL